MLDKINAYLSHFGAIGAVIPASAVRGAEQYRSVVIAAFPYYNGISKGNISLYARGEDYHRVVARILSGVVEILPKNGRHTVAVDVSPIDERYTACIAGLGVMGKNGLFISEKMGSFAFLGSVMTTSELDCGSVHEPQRCIDCNKCVEACPGDAIGEQCVDYTRCVSNISQKKGELTVEERELLGRAGMIFGCDACQLCCPYNLGIGITPIEAFRNELISTLNPEDIDGISNKKFKEIYGKYAFSWRGAAVLKRNVGIIYGGQYGTRESEQRE